MEQEVLIALVHKIGLIFLIVSSISWLSRRSVSIVDAIPTAICSIIAISSFFIQLCFLLRQPELLIIFELIFLTIAIIYIAQRPKLYFFDLISLWRTLRPWNFSVILLYTTIIYLGLLAFLIPEGNYDSMRYNIARIPMFMQEKTFFLDSFTEYHQVVFPVGGDVLFFPSLRFNTDYGLAINAWFAYLVIVSSTYATVRYFGPKSIALTVTLIIASVPLLVFQATGTKPDIWCAAVASTLILLLIRSTEKINGFEMLMQAILIAFGLSLKFTFIAFAVPFFLYQLALIVKRSEIKPLARLAGNNWPLVFFVFIIILVLSQAWLIIHNFFYWGHFSGPEGFIARHTNPDGLVGAAANLVRYFFQSIHFLTPTDLAFERLFHIRLTDLLHEFYSQYIHPLTSNLGIADSRPDMDLRVRTRWGDGENGAWFGPLGVIIVLPALVYALFHKNTALKAISACVIVYVLILSWKISWMPWNGRFFSLVPAASAAPVAALLVRISGVIWVSGTLRVMALSILLYSAVFNQEKELLNARALINLVSDQGDFSYILRENIWFKTEFGSNRNYYTDQYFGDKRVEEIAKLILPGSKVGLITRGSSWVYPFLASRPDVEFIPLTIFKQPEVEHDFKMDELQYFLCINTNCEQLRQSAIELWPVESAYERLGVLLKKL